MSLSARLRLPVALAAIASVGIAALLAGMALFAWLEWRVSR